MPNIQPKTQPRDEIYSFAAQLARDAGELLRSFFMTSAANARLKADNTPVTDADFAADAFITQRIQQAYPQAVIVSEENATTLAAPLTGDAWVVDPLDGTNNFSKGLHTWGVSLAYLRAGQPTAAALYFPILNELYTAQVGGGAFLNGQPILVRPPDDTEADEIFACCSRTFSRYNFSVPYKTRVQGCAAYDFCVLARGSAVLMLQARPKLWDIAGGWLVVAEAGGVLAALDEPPFPPRPGDLSRRSYATLAASTPELLAQVQNSLTERKSTSSPKSV